MIQRYGMLILAVVAFSAEGCRYRDPSVDLLEAELRWMEDQLYLAEDEYRKVNGELVKYKQAYTALRKSARATEARSEDGPNRPGVAEEDDISPPRIDAPPGPTDSGAPGQGESQLIEPPAPTDDGLQINVPETSILPLDLSIRPASAIEQLVSEAGLQDREIARIKLDAYFTSGIDFDGEPGAERLAIAIEPQNSAGQSISVSGEISIVAVKADDKSPVARWNLDAHETEKILRKSLLGRGLHVKLPWRGDVPNVNRVTIYVKFKTPTGRMLVAKKTITTHSYHDVPGTWTPAIKLNSPEEAALATDKTVVPKQASPAARDSREASRPQRPVWRPYR